MEISRLKNEIHRLSKTTTNQVHSPLPNFISPDQYASAINLEKEQEISRLKQAISKLSKIEQRKKQGYFNFIDEAEYEALQNISKSSRNDSTFVLTAIKFLYPDRTVLLNRSLTGRDAYRNRQSGEQHRERYPKRPLSPHKLNVLRSLFTERITNMNLSKDEVEARNNTRSVNVLIGSALTNLQKKYSKLAKE